MISNITADDLPESFTKSIMKFDALHRNNIDLLQEWTEHHYDVEDYAESKDIADEQETVKEYVEDNDCVPRQFGEPDLSIVGAARFLAYWEERPDSTAIDYTDIEEDAVIRWLFADDPLLSMQDATAALRYVRDDPEANVILSNVPSDVDVPAEIPDDRKPDWVDQYYGWCNKHKTTEELPTLTRDEKLNFIADAMEDEFDFMTLDTEAASVKDRTLYVYDEDRGVYTTEGTSVVESQLRQWFGELPTHQWKEVINRLKAIPSTDPDALNAREHDDRLRCVRNGVLNLDTGELLEDSPDYLFTEYLPQEFDPDAEPEQVEETLRGLVETEEDYQTLLEWLGFILAPDYPLHRFLIMTGKGGNGKGVFMQLISAFVGDDNVSGVTLEKMQASETFGLSPLEHSMVNIDGDATGGRFYGSALTTLKKASGGDQITIRKMHQEPYFVRNTSKMMFSANEPPRIIDDGDSIPRRLLSVAFPYSFVENPDPENEYEKQKLPEEEFLDPILDSEEEMSGLLNLAVEAYQTLIDRGCFAKEVGSTARERYDEYMGLADPIAQFRTKYLQQADGHALPKDVVYQVYVAFESDQQGDAKRRSEFWDYLGKQVDYYTQRQTRIGGDPVRYKHGVTFTEAAAEHLTESHKEMTAEVYSSSMYLDASDLPEMMLESAEDEPVESDPDDDDDDEPESEVTALSTGFESFTATLQTKLEPKPWQDGRGVMADESGKAIMYTIESPADSSSDIELEEGTTYRFEMARLETEDGDLIVRIMPNTTDIIVEEEEAATEQTPIPDADDAEKQSTATDGGADVAQAKRRQQIVEELHASDEVTVAGLAGKLGLNPDKVAKTLDSLAESRNVSRDTDSDGNEVFKQ